MKFQRYIVLPMALALIGAGLIAPTSADAQRFRMKVPNAKMQKGAELKATKTALARHGGAGKKAYSELKAALRSELRLRGLANTTEARLGAARRELDANKTPENQRNFNIAQANFNNATLAHNNARALVDSTRNASNMIRQGKLEELRALRQKSRQERAATGQEVTDRMARRGISQRQSIAIQQVRNAQRAQPKFVATAQAVPVQSAGLRANAPNQVPGLIANPAAYPLAALAAQLPDVRNRPLVRQNSYNDVRDVRGQGPAQGQSSSPPRYEAPNSTLVF